MSPPVWQWDESLQRGTDYADVAQVRAYDERMGAMRDISGEIEQILEFLDLSQDDVLLEVGTGTGALARAAAKRCRKVIAVDVSATMLAYAKERADEDGIGNIVFEQAGFLTYRHEGEPVAAAVSQLALHHLPDAWQLVALQRLACLLRRQGGFYLSDVVFPEEAETDPCGFFEAMLRSVPGDSVENMAAHVRQEFSTFDWVMRGLLERAGFVLEQVEFAPAYLAHYHCRRR